MWSVTDIGKIMVRSTFPNEGHSTVNHVSTVPHPKWRAKCRTHGCYLGMEKQELGGIFWNFGSQ